MTKQSEWDVLIQKLRDAIDEALCEAFPVVEALADLEHAGLCPAICVEVKIPDDTGNVSDAVTITSEDKLFLRQVGIVSDSRVIHASRPAARCTAPPCFVHRLPPFTM